MHTSRGFISCLVSEFLNGKVLFVNNCHKFKTIATATVHDRYEDLQNISSMVYPFLMYYNIEFHITKQGVDTFFKYSYQ